MQKKIKIIGIDPGIALVGYSVIEVETQHGKINLSKKPRLIDCGVISTKSDKKLWERLHLIKLDLTELIQKYKPEVAVVELIYFTKNVKTGIAVAHGRGVILQTLSEQGIDNIIEFTPTHLKQVLFGHGKASKHEIQAVVSQFLGLQEIIKPDDAADATAIALAFLRSEFAFRLDY